MIDRRIVAQSTAEQGCKIRELGYSENILNNKNNPTYYKEAIKY